MPSAIAPALPPRQRAATHVNWLATIALAVVPLWSASGAEPTKPPNVVVFLADDK